MSTKPVKNLNLESEYPYIEAQMCETCKYFDDSEGTYSVANLGRLNDKPRAMFVDGQCTFSNDVYLFIDDKTRRTCDNWEKNK